MSNIPKSSGDLNPAERGYKHIADNLEVLDHVCTNMIIDEQGGAENWVSGLEVVKIWNGFSEAQKDVVRRRALQRLQDFVVEYNDQKYRDRLGLDRTWNGE